MAPVNVVRRPGLGVAPHGRTSGRKKQDQKIAACGSSYDCGSWPNGGKLPIVDLYATVWIGDRFLKWADLNRRALYIEPDSRGGGIGKALMTGVARWALSRGMGRLKWDVLAGNENAERFLPEPRGQPYRKWIAWHMGPENLDRLAMVRRKLCRSRLAGDEAGTACIPVA
jgi:GNAT superfamily N-acetyltransferase